MSSTSQSSLLLRFPTCFDFPFLAFASFSSSSIPGEVFALTLHTPISLKSAGVFFSYNCFKQGWWQHLPHNINTCHGGRNHGAGFSELADGWTDGHRVIDGFAWLLALAFGFGFWLSVSKRTYDR